MLVDSRRGQMISWVWATMTSFFGLVVVVGLWIFINESQAQLLIPAMAQTGANIVGINNFNQILKVVPFVVLASFALFVWIMAASTRGEGV